MKTRFITRNMDEIGQPAGATTKASDLDCSSDPHGHRFSSALLLAERDGRGKVYSCYSCSFLDVPSSWINLSEETSSVRRSPKTTR